MIVEDGLMIRGKVFHQGANHLDELTGEQGGRELVDGGRESGNAVLDEWEEF